MHIHSMPMPSKLLVWTLLGALLSSCQASLSSVRNVDRLSQWAREKGVVMHESLRWKSHASSDANDEEGENDGSNKNHDDADNMGLELREPVPPGTILLRVPRSIVLDARTIRRELEEEHPDQVATALRTLEESKLEAHADGFFIFVRVLQCCFAGASSPWAPYLASLPRSYVSFSPTERACLPFFARYIADYQEAKFEGFCHAIRTSGLVEDCGGTEEEKEKDDDETFLQTARWAFGAVSSRFWKTSDVAGASVVEEESTETSEFVSTSELVPVGDMFNHREPPNVAVTHEGGYVNFIYKGEAAEDGEPTDYKQPFSRDLYITYGQPSNPHRFLGIFGFVDEAMPSVWSHLHYPDNPFSADAEAMVFRASDGTVPKRVWDAVLYALLEPEHPPGKPPHFTEAQHARYRKHTAGVLERHLDRQLDELRGLRDKLRQAGETPHRALVSRHNAWLTGVFERARQRVVESRQR